MTKKQTPEDSHFALFLRRFIKRQNGMLKVYGEITAGFEKELDALQVSDAGKTKVSKSIERIEAFESLKNSFFRYFEKRASTEYAVEDIGERIKLYSALPKGELINRLSTTTYEHELMHHEIRYLSAAILFFIENYAESSVKEILADSRRQATAKQREDANKKCLKHCLEVLKDKVRRPLKATDYLQFERTVVELYPTQPVLKKPRLTKEEKKLPKKKQEELITEKQSNGWKTPTLRKFFKEHTGLNPSTKK